MASVQLLASSHQFIIHSHFYFYGDAASEQLAKQIATDIDQHWNEPKARIQHKGNWYDMVFDIKGFYEPQLQPEIVWYNTDPKLFYFRIEEYSPMHVSFVDGLGCNTGYFKLANLLQTSTTAAHEYGHMLGLHHPDELDIRGQGTPGIMYPRGTICDPHYQYDSAAAPGETGGTLDPQHRKVLLSDIEALNLHKLRFDDEGFAVLGDFTSIYHSHYLPEE
ncbi:MAG: peptidase M10 [Lacibacter sp.]